MLSITKKATVHVDSYASNIRKDRFEINIDSWRNPTICSSGCTWLEVGPNNSDFQFGKFSTLEDHPSDQSQVSTKRTITFSRAYHAPPLVVVWLTAFDMGLEKILRLKTYATDVTATGFNIHIDTWGDSVLYSATASWVSYPVHKDNIFSGTFSTWDISRDGCHQLTNSASVNFGTNVFHATPTRILLALNSLDIDFSQNTGVKVWTSSINSGGMTWHIDSWGDTALHGAGCSYIALG